MPVVLEKKYIPEFTETLPIVKWAGGKRQLIADLKNNLPKKFNRYFEPFIGGGALFFNIQPENAYISDINPELINLYQVIKNNTYELIEDLKQHKNTEEYFYEIRNIDRNSKYKKWSDIQKASRFIYMNRTCFNGLYRVNSKGEFNVPYGKYSNPRILDEVNLLNCSQLFQNTEIRHSDFSEILNNVQKGDFVYFDPPYAPLNETSSFTSYTKEGFGEDMQVKLKELCDELDNMGVHFMLSNSDTKGINKLYKNYEIKKVFASRAINSVASKRGKISEVLVRNY